MGNGLGGQTSFSSTSSSNGKAGVAGSDLSSTGTFNSGVKGTSTRGIGLAGQSTSNIGTSGTSTSNDGVYGASTSYVGVYGKSTSYTGVFGTGPAYGVAGNSGNGAGVYGASTNGIGIKALSSTFIGEQVSGGGVNFTSGAQYPALSVNGDGLSSDLIDACNQNGPNPCRLDTTVPQFSVTNIGSIYITGLIHTAGSCSAGCAWSPSGREARATVYTARKLADD